MNVRREKKVIFLRIISASNLESISRGRWLEWRMRRTTFNFPYLDHDTLFVIVILDQPL